MRYKIKHEIKGRIRIHLNLKEMSIMDADILQYKLLSNSSITEVKVYERTCDVVICYIGARSYILRFIQNLDMDQKNIPEYVWQNTGRATNREYWDKLVWHIFMRGCRRCFIPVAVGEVFTLVKSVGYIWKGITTLAHRKMEVPVLDATAISVSMLRGDFKTASSIMFMLGIGEILEEWTHKKSVDDLARSMSLNVDKVWLRSGEKEILTDVRAIQKDDEIVIHMGNVIPFDGVVISGGGAVNQASITGESIPVAKETGGYVYAGTVLEEGELQVRVKECAGSNKYEKIVTMIEETEKLKSGMEGRAEHLADRLVPYTLLGTGLVYLFTRNVTRALSVLMVDFSCALKLAMPISVLSAIREANSYKITVKGGKFLEQVMDADTIVFDKTGTLTKAAPTVVQVVPFVDEEPEELLRLAACLEEHFPHSMARAVVEEAQKRSLVHEEIHSKWNILWLTAFLLW